MPFSNQEPKEFSRDRIERLKPDKIGVYGIFREGQWIYVGRGDIRARLLAHLNGDNPCIIQEQPTHWVATLISTPEARERELIRELDPICNERVG